jgi:hypothetical protein
MRFLKNIILLLLLFPANYAFGVDGPVKLHRACLNGNNAILTWSNITDNCNSFTKVYVYGQDAPGSPFVIIDSVTNKTLTEFLHLNARIQSNYWRYYLKVQFACDGVSSI